LKEEFWQPLFAGDFKDYLKQKYEVGHADMIKQDNPEDMDV